MIKQKNLYLRVIASILCITMVMNIFSTRVLADSSTNIKPLSSTIEKNYNERIEEFDEISKKEIQKWVKNDTSEGESISDFEYNSVQDEEVFIEIEDKREKNIKHFYNGINYEAVVYPYPVHYQEDGKWKDIDNSLIEVNDDEEDIEDKSIIFNNSKKKEKIYKIKQNDFKLKLAKKANAEKLITLKKDKYSLSWNIESASNSKIEFESFDTQYNSLSKKDKKKTLKNISSNATYKDALPDIDLNYIILPTQIKENFIIKKYTENDIIINIKVNGLKAELLKDNSIIFLDNKTAKTIFTIPTPFMYDDNGEVSYNVDVRLEKNKNNHYKITLIPDKTWLRDSNRKYPIVLDPTTESDQKSSFIKDTYISENYPDTNYKLMDRLKIGRGSSSGFNQSYIKFTLPYLPSGSIVNEATLNMYTINDNDTPTNVVARHLFQSWDIDELRWRSQPGWDGTYDAYKTITVKGKQSWGISQIVSDWYNGTTPNNGLVLKTVDFNGEYTEFYSADNINYNYRPQITVTYSSNQILPESLGTVFNINTGEKGKVNESFNIIANILNAHHIAIKITRPDGSDEWIVQNGENFSLNYTPTMTGIYKIQALARNTATDQDIGTETKSSAIKTVSIYAESPLGDMNFIIPKKGVKNTAFAISSSWENAHHVAVKVTKPDGDDEWFVNNGENYNFNYTPVISGLYTITLYARNTESETDTDTQAKEFTKYINIYITGTWSEQVIQAKKDLDTLGYTIDEGIYYNSIWTSNFNSAIWSFLNKNELTQRYNGSNNSTDLLFLWLRKAALDLIPHNITWGDITINTVTPTIPKKNEKISIVAECYKAYRIAAHITDSSGNSYGWVESTTDNDFNGKTDIQYEFSPLEYGTYYLEITAVDSSKGDVEKLRISGYEIKVEQPKPNYFSNLGELDTIDDALEGKSGGVIYSLEYNHKTIIPNLDYVHYLRAKLIMNKLSLGEELTANERAVYEYAANYEKEYEIDSSHPDYVILVALADWKKDPARLLEPFMYLFGGAILNVASSQIAATTELLIAGVKAYGWKNALIMFNGGVLAENLAHLNGQGLIKEGLGILSGNTYRVTEDKLNKLKKHITDHNYESLENTAMISRLENALNTGSTITGADASFYFHELKEAELMANGLDYTIAHDRALKFYEVSRYSVYHPQVIKEYSEWFDIKWLEFWGVE